MGKVIFEGDDFKRMYRSDLSRLQSLISTKSFGIHEISYKEEKIKVQITKKGDDIIVRRFRVM